MPLLTETDPRAVQPDNILYKMFPHQLASLDRMVKWEQNPECEIPAEQLRRSRATMFIRCGFLCDPVGAGKTLTMLALAASGSPPPIPERRTLQSNRLGYIEINNYERGKKYHPTTIIIAPHGLVYHWKKHIKDCLSPELSKKAVSISTRKHLAPYKEQYLLMNGKLPWLILCSSTRWREFGETLRDNDIMVDRIIYDEADTLKIPCNPEVLSHFYWLMSATPERWNTRTSGFLRSLMNHIFFLTQEDLMFHNRRRILYGHLFVESDINFVRKSLNLPPINEQNIICRLDEYSTLYGFALSHNIRRALDVGDMNLVMSQLGCENEEELYNRITQRLKTKINTYKSRREYYTSSGRSTEYITNEIKKMDIQLKSLHARLTDDECVICLENINPPKTISPCCNHTFCLQCLFKAIDRQSKCPLCRSELSVSDIKIITNDKNNNYKSNPTRWEALESILLEEPKWTLIFSDYQFSKVKLILEKCNLKYAELKGNYNQIPRLCEKYNSGEIPVLLLNTRFQGQGHHLPLTKKVILLHDVMKSTRDQLVGRAQRLGRKDTLTVITLNTSSADNTDIEIM